MLARASAAARRGLSSLSAFPYSAPMPSAVEFPRVARGLDYALNWSLAADSLTTRGEAYRNATVRELLEFAGPRGAVRVTKQRALELLGPRGAGAQPAPSPAPAASSFATDAGFPGRTVMDVEDFESRLASVSTRPRERKRAQARAPSRAPSLPPH
jgi:hypothetical protein